jgi:hypothetical protein
MLAAGIAGVGLLGVSLLGIITHGLPARLPTAVVQYALASDDTNPARHDCIDRQPEDVLSGRFCRFGAVGAPATIMIWGDSQADPWMPAFDEFARKAGVAGLFAAHGGCPPLLEIRRVNQTPSHKCSEFNEAVFGEIARSRLQKVILIGRWFWYIKGVEHAGMEEGLGAVIALQGETDEGASLSSTRERVFELGLVETARRIAETGAEVWVVEQPPTYAFDVPKYLAYSALRGISAVGRARKEVLEAHQFQRNLFEKQHVKLLDTLQYVCPQIEANCMIEADGKSLYADFTHLSVYGARRVLEWAVNDTSQTAHFSLGVGRSLR